MSMSSSIALDLGVQQHRGCTSRVLHKKQRKTNPEQTKKQTRKPKTKKQRKTKKQTNLEKSRFWFIFVFFLWWFFQSVCFFVVNLFLIMWLMFFLLVVFFFATINLLCSRWPQNVKQQVHWFVIFAICSMKNMPVLHVSWMSVMFP